MLAGGEPNSIRSAARFVFKAFLRPRGFPIYFATDSAIDIASRTVFQCSAAQQEPTSDTLLGTSAELHGAGAVFVRPAQPIHLRDAQTVWVQTGTHRDQTRNRPCNNTIGTTEGRQVEQLAVGDTRQHGRGDRAAPANQARQQRQTTGNLGVVTRSSQPALVDQVRGCQRMQPGQRLKRARCHTPTSAVAPPSMD